MAQDRIRLKLPVRFGRRALDRSGHANDISESGAHVVTNEVFKVGSRIRLAIELGDYTAEHEAEVVWAIGVPEHMVGSLAHGMGVRFLHPDPDWSRRFRQWKASLVPA